MRFTDARKQSHGGEAFNGKTLGPRDSLLAAMTVTTTMDKSNEL